MGAYRCSVCAINYSFPTKCLACGGSVWWGKGLKPSDDKDKAAALQSQIDKHAEEWAEPVDKIVNWRFSLLVAAGYDFAAANELAANRLIDVHKAIELASEHGATAAYLRFF